MVVGIAVLIYLSISLGGVTIFGSSRYSTTAHFESITGLKKGASVEIAGVNIGKVGGISLEDDLAVVDLQIDNEIQLTDDSIASIRTKGMIGEKFIKITPGGSDDYLAEGDELMETESAISLEELISKYIFEK